MANTVPHLTNPRAVVAFNTAGGGILAAALKSLLAIPAEMNPFAFYNASISRLAWDKQVKVLSINELDHLKAIEVISEASAGDL